MASEGKNKHLEWHKPKYVLSIYVCMNTPQSNTITDFSTLDYSSRALCPKKKKEKKPLLQPDRVETVVTVSQII